MRTAILLALCLFLFAYRATSVADTDGEPVLNDSGAYYLVPVSNELGGGLGLAIVGDDNFPKTVVLDTNLANGLPVRFSSPLRIRYISSSMFLAIRFVSSATEPAQWKVDPEFPIGWTVKVSQTETSFGPFKVQPAKTGYKIVYYPEESDTGADLGIVHTGGYYRLVVKDGDPFIFNIKKAPESSARMSIV